MASQIQIYNHEEPIVIENIVQALKDDVWAIINEEEVPQRDFFSYIIYLLLDDTFALKEAKEFADRVREIYEGELQEVERHIAEENGDVLKVLRQIKKNVQAQITPILHKIATKKER